MEDKWFFYLTLFLVFFVISSSMGFYSGESARDSFPRTTSSTQGFSPLSVQGRLDLVSLKEKGH